MSEHTSEFESTISVCAHTVKYNYEFPWDFPQTEEFQKAMEKEAEDRATQMINEGCTSGELNFLWQGEHEIRGWWQIE